MFRTSSFDDYLQIMPTKTVRIFTRREDRFWGEGKRVNSVNLIEAYLGSISRSSERSDI